MYVTQEYRCGRYLPVKCFPRLCVLMSGIFESVLQAVRRSDRVITLSGVTSDAAKAHLLSRLQAETGKPFAVVTASNNEMDCWASDLRYFAGQGSGGGIVSLPSFETDPYSGASPHAETQERRALALWQLGRKTADLVVLP